ncbi:hypothetical protein PLESTB_001598800 [Pleodorina starrii]|uniref:Uncharacterized protein n=1 Tax=Pleodorina starrii TaxID=330485 RepID=A0A9W6F8G5_9CHLO|nr:hypothetical protein PLESTM_001044600 [Pleodorina starrii]GLC60327.1 hypothetical protein PLESTB_001598800 [Pleodorina starrii]GLC77522.1 hypothetical protein PLESTF_001950400 [Pleodorina starrii]
MSWSGRGGRNMAPPGEHRTYDDYEDSYAAPKARGGPPQQQTHGDRGQRFDRPPLSSRQPYIFHDDRVYAGPQRPSYGQQQGGWGEHRSSRAPYSTNHYQGQAYEQHVQQPDPTSQRALTERGTKWSGTGGRYPSSTRGGGGRAPGAGANGQSGGGGSSGGGSVRGSGGGRPPSTGRSGGAGGFPTGGNGSVFRRLGSGGGNGSGGGGFARQPSNGRATGGRPPSGGSGAGIRASSSDRTIVRAAAAAASGAGGGGIGVSASVGVPGSARPRAPYVAPVVAPEPPAQSAATLSVSVSEVQPDAPSNPHFITPAFPQGPRTRTDSCNNWAVMVEAGAQSLEAVAGPFLEGALMELFGESWERELFNLGLKLPPFSAATCAELVGRCKQLHERLPITIHKRVEAVAKATSTLASSPSSLEPEDVTAAHAAMKGMMQDCIKAMKMPSLLGSGSRQFRSFTAELMPHAESMVVYYDMLIADCSEASAARQAVRAAAAVEAAGAAACRPAAGGEPGGAADSALTSP